MGITTFPLTIIYRQAGGQINNNKLHLKQIGFNAIYAFFCFVFCAFLNE